MIIGIRSAAALLMAACGTLLAPVVSAQQLDGLDSGDTAWIIVATALVLFMTLPGLAMFYGGLVRAKNWLSVLMQCLILAALMSLVWLAAGYSLAFDSTGMVAGESGLHAFIGTLDKAFLRGVDGGVMSGSIPEVLFFAFQMTFAIITPALIVGTFVERVKFSALLLFSVIWLLVVYVPICHMTWAGDGGFFADRGVFDFAGGIVVHITAGLAALVACIVIGPRDGFPTRAMPPHSLGMTFAGTAMLWVGWFGFNAGSALAANGDAAMALVVTHLSASTATLVWLTIEWIKFGKPSLLGAATGAIAGLAAVTPASGFIGPVGGVVIGAVSGFVCWLFSVRVKYRFGYDDSLDVFGVHGVGGIVGTLLVAVFAHEYFGGNQGDLAIGSQFATQLFAVTVAVLYTLVATFLILKLVDLLLGLRVAADDEQLGLDQASHGESGYNL